MKRTKHPIWKMPKHSPKGSMTSRLPQHRDSGMDKPQPSSRGQEEGCWAINMTALDKEGKFLDSDRKLFRAATLEKALVKASDYANWNLGWISHSIIVEEEK